MTKSEAGARLKAALMREGKTAAQADALLDRVDANAKEAALRRGIEALGAAYWAGYAARSKDGAKAQSAKHLLAEHKKTVADLVADYYGPAVGK